MKLFNIDLHISVIADVQYILKELYGDDVEIENWSISGHCWVFRKRQMNVKFVNAQTWKNFNKEMIDNFVKEYGDYLSTFDGFIVTHTPVFALLFESFNKPIICVNSCRYEQPFSFNENNNLGRWNLLSLKLKQMHDKGQLTMISNNKGDQEYLRLGTGIESIHIPSLCLYTNVKYEPSTDINVVYSDFDLLKKPNKMISRQEFVGGNYSWANLYSCNSMIHFPYEMSTMSIAEQYSANVPLFFPSKIFLKKLISMHQHHFCSRYIMINSVKSNKVYPKSLDIAMDDNTWIDFWVDKADYYDEENMKYIIYFDSLRELDSLTKQTNMKEVSEKMRQHNEIRKEKVYSSWKKVMDKIIETIKE
jgi:hypothetical protein